MSKSQEVNEFEEDQAAATAAIFKMGKDLRKAAKDLKEHEARFLVDSYYAMQDKRKREDNQIRALGEAGEPHAIISWLSSVNSTAEDIIKGALDIYSRNQPLGKWARSICGIGPVIAAGLMAHIDLKKTPTVGGVWRFAGLDPTREWYNDASAAKLIADTLGNVPKGDHALTDDQVTQVAVAAKTKLGALKGMRREKNDEDKMALVPFDEPFTYDSLITVLKRRPFNARLKVLCWKIGESFIKQSGRPSDVYGKMILERKAWETEQNENLAYKSQAEAILKVRPGHQQRKILAAGKLPPGHILARAKRHAVKCFLAHYHEVGRKQLGLPVPAPWVIQHGGHVHKIEPPNKEVA